MDSLHHDSILDLYLVVFSWNQVPPNLRPHIPWLTGHRDRVPHIWHNNHVSRGVVYIYILYILFGWVWIRFGPRYNPENGHSLFFWRSSIAVNHKRISNFTNNSSHYLNHSSTQSQIQNRHVQIGLIFAPVLIDQFGWTVAVSVVVVVYGLEHGHGLCGENRANT